MCTIDVWAQITTERMAMAGNVAALDRPGGPSALAVRDVPGRDADHRIHRLKVLELYGETIHLEANKGIPPLSVIKEKAMMNSSKIVLLAALAALSIASPAFANAVDNAARHGAHIYNMVPGSLAPVHNPATSGYDPGIETQR
jgi:hypothetical protein